MSRKEEIVIAAESLLREHGEAGFSLREVAKSVGIKLASLQYHFPTKEKLISAVLTHLMDSYQSDVEAVVAQAGPDPKAQLIAAARAISGVDQTERFDPRLEIHLWSMAQNDPVVRNVLDENHKDYLHNIAEMIIAANPDIDEEEARSRAVLIASIQEGSLLFLDQEVSGFSQSEILNKVCQTCVDIALAKA